MDFPAILVHRVGIQVVDGDPCLEVRGVPRVRPWHGFHQDRTGAFFRLNPVAASTIPLYFIYDRFAELFASVASNNWNSRIVACWRLREYSARHAARRVLEEVDFSCGRWWFPRRRSSSSALHNLTAYFLPSGRQPAMQGQSAVEVMDGRKPSRCCGVRSFWRRPDGVGIGIKAPRMLSICGLSGKFFAGAYIEPRASPNS